MKPGTRPHIDPFSDRKARLIRNALSSALKESLACHDAAIVIDRADELLQNTTSALYTSYIRDRLKRYRRSLAIIREKGISSPLEQAYILWDEELFFEVHEIVEHLWLQATGPRKAALQGLIRAAGFYVLAEHDSRKRGAGKMAAKAVESLERDYEALPSLPSRQQLIARLKALDPVPPKLNFLASSDVDRG